MSFPPHPWPVSSSSPPSRHHQHRYHPDQQHPQEGYVWSRTRHSARYLTENLRILVSRRVVPKEYSSENNPRRQAICKMEENSSTNWVWETLHIDKGLLHIKGSEKSFRTDIYLRLFDPIFLKYILPLNHVFHLTSINVTLNLCSTKHT